MRLIGIEAGLATHYVAREQRFDQGRETERFEVNIGEPDREGFAPGDVPRGAIAAGPSE